MGGPRGVDSKGAGVDSADIDTIGAIEIRLIEHHEERMKRRGGHGGFL